MEIYLLGTNHKTAEVEFREKLALSPARLPAALDSLYAHPAIQEAEIISTCNRTELYVVSRNTPEIYEILLRFLSDISGIELNDKQHFFYRMKGQQAIHHLFKVAAGLDSMVLGEPQILGQMKDAYRVATEKTSTGLLINRLMEFSFTVGKRVRNETNLGQGAVSVAFAAIELAQKIFHDLSKRTVLLIGAGETGELAARHLKEKGIGKLYITNRTLQKAKDLCHKLDGELIEFSKMETVFNRVDIIIGTVSASDFLVSYGTISRQIPKRGSGPLFMIDIGVPRNFDPEINKLESVFLHDIDDLKQIVDRNLNKRQKEVPQAEAIVLQEVEKFLGWKKSLEITPTIVQLRKKYEEIRESELIKYRSKLNEKEYAQLDKLTRAVMNKFLHLPTVHLKQYNNGHPEGLYRVDLLREIFGLEDEE